MNSDFMRMGMGYYSKFLLKITFNNKILFKFKLAQKTKIDESQ